MHSNHTTPLRQLAIAVSPYQPDELTDDIADAAVISLLVTYGEQLVRLATAARTALSLLNSGNADAARGHMRNHIAASFATMQLVSSHPWLKHLTTDSDKTEDEFRAALQQLIAGLPW